MPCEIVWLPAAFRDINRLRDFIASENPVAAQRAARRIIDGVSALKANPEAGVPVDSLTSYRELALPFGSGAYIVRYRYERPARVVIVRARHSRESDFHE